MSANSSTSDTHAANNIAVSSTSSANQKPHSVKAPDVMSDDSFHAFTHTVDALALQQSSIGWRIECKIILYAVENMVSSFIQYLRIV